MIAFNFNIVFSSEPLLEDDDYNPALATINVELVDESIQHTALQVCSDWLDMSGRKVMYQANREFSLATEAGSRWALVVKDVVTLFWSIDGCTLQYQPKRLYTVDRLRFWVCHTLLPIKFALEKRYEMLHVGAVEVDGCPIFFSAESFGGKSTLTDYFIQQGHPLFSDDSLAIYQQEGAFFTVASYPFHRPYREPEVLGYSVDNIALQPKPVHAGYILEKASAEATISIEELKGVEKYKAFHFSGFIDLEFFKTEHFLLRSALAKSIPVYRVIVPWKIERLAEVYSAIVLHCSKSMVNN